MIKVTVWNEYVHEKRDEKVREIYPEGIHGAIKKFLDADGEFTVRTATLEEDQHGLTEEVLKDTDVLLWWGHEAHDKVSDEIVERVCNRVQAGMGLIVLHSGHHSKVFKRLTGGTCNLQWREIGEKSRIWTVLPNHPIAKGVPEQFLLEHEEMYGEPFGIPNPDEVVFMSWFEGGNVFRSGCCFKRGGGKIFYFQPGHETYPAYYDPNIQQVIKNAVRWAKSDEYVGWDGCPWIEHPLEKVENPIQE